MHGMHGWHGRSGHRDGRYLFADTDAGVEVVDSGVWTWDHVDHFHYYRTSPSMVGTVAGEGPAILTTSGYPTTGGTGVFFPESGEAVLTVTTRIGVVVGCADGALLATYEGDEPQFEHIAFPDGTQAPRATDFRGRKGRPAVAALAGDQGFWLLDTRAREWRFVPTDQPLV
ncbi:hypothetical protein ACTHRK_15610 [Dietzia cercidiphylli]|uniref:hypothetical protein n=1 Tax=Dietzia cercidiphylli TaxID=498199 RepID=UPI003F7F61A1